MVRASRAAHVPASWLMTIALSARPTLRTPAQAVLTHLRLIMTG